MAGEHCDFETMDWIRGIIKRPIIDHFWQTESGWPMVSMSGDLTNKSYRFILKECSLVIFYDMKSIKSSWPNGLNRIEQYSCWCLGQTSAWL